MYGAYQLELSEDEKDKGDYITRRFKLSPVDKVGAAPLLFIIDFRSINVCCLLVFSS